MAFNKDNISLWFENNLDVDNRTIYMGSISSNDGTESGVDSFMAESFIKGIHILESKNNSPITIIMNNPGGDWYHGMAIYDAIRNTKNHCTIKVYGYAMSMGSIILQAADHRIMMPNSKFMIHNGTSSYINMSLPLAKKWVHEEERINEDMENIYLESMYRKDPQDLLKTLSNILNKPLSKKQSIKDILNKYKLINLYF